jgi:hypothetical protein
MNDVRLLVTDITDNNRREKFTLAVGSLAKAMQIPLTVRPKDRETGEAFVYQAQGDLVKRWTDEFADVTDTIYTELLNLLDLPQVTTFSKSLGDDQPASHAIIFRGKILFNPETGKPIYREDFKKIINAIERFLNKRLSGMEKRITLNAISLGRVLARRLRDMPASELRKIKLDALAVDGKTVDWVSKNISWLDKIDGRAKEEDRLSLARRYRGMKMLMDISEESMGSRITRVSDDIVHNVRETIISGMKERKNRSAISQDLFDRMGNMNRDWGRIVETEIMEATNNAFLKETVIASKSGEAVYFERIEMHDSHVCPFCESIRGKIVRWSETPLQDDNIDDKYAKKAIWEGKTNIGRKARNYWVPASTVHPWCRGSWVRWFPPIKEK